MDNYVKALGLDEFINRNQQAVVKLANKQLAIIKGQDEEIYAIDNRCPHEGFPLSEGTIDGKNYLTCNWHNWKFCLKTGDCVIGGDDVRTYPIKIIDEQIYVDLSPPPLDQIEKRIMKGLRTAFEKREYGHIARELARLHYSGIEPIKAIESVILWSAERFEYGMTHAYAALTDWLWLHDQKQGNLEEQLICLTEAIEHVSFDALRRPLYPFETSVAPYKSQKFIDAIEEEEESQAMAMLNGALAENLSLDILEKDFSSAALMHYNDFGHSLIYVYKTFELARRFSTDAAAAVLRCMLRSLCYTSREDLIPEFREYAERLTTFKEKLSLDKEHNIGESLSAKNPSEAMDWLSNLNKAPSYENLFDYLLYKNAQNFCLYDINMQYETQNNVSHNIGWLDFTHAITFANAVRILCLKFPELWPAGLMQMACFYGRNASHIDKGHDAEQWVVEDFEAFKKTCIEKILDHGLPVPIFSAHLMKNFRAAVEEHEPASAQTKDWLLRAHNRFFHSPIKGKHAKRLVQQGIKLVQKDYA
ncbi:MAG: Rieske (2Fe-2S) protein [Myxococcota bacterium]|nr:Rieske (2Fe-2S) protein [Myxococcota bacterium]